MHADYVTTALFTSIRMMEAHVCAHKPYVHSFTVSLVIVHINQYNTLTGLPTILHIMVWHLKYYYISPVNSYYDCSCGYFSTETVHDTSHASITA